MDTCVYEYDLRKTRSSQNFNLESSISQSSAFIDYLTKLRCMIVVIILTILIPIQQSLLFQKVSWMNGIWMLTKKLLLYEMCRLKFGFSMESWWRWGNLFYTNSLFARVFGEITLHLSWRFRKNALHVWSLNVWKKLSKRNYFPAYFLDEDESRGLYLCTNFLY